MNSYILAFLAGVLGAVTGGNAAFVMTGFIGIVVAIMSKCGADVGLISDQFLNLVFMPCVIFNGANAALSFSANIKKYMHNGQDLNKSMYPTHDPVVLLVGGLFGLLGYLVFVGLTAIGFPSDLHSHHDQQKEQKKHSLKIDQLIQIHQNQQLLL